jgi:DNA-binding HxlR family transcriptional regulator
VEIDETTSPVRPGRPVRGSATGRPVMALLDLLGRRWTMRILWELRDAPAGFRELQRRCDQMSSSMLDTRLSELSDAGLADNDSGAWALTESGRTLLIALKPLYRFADHWADELTAGVR